MKDLETIKKINGTTESEAARARVPFTYANGPDKPAVQAEDELEKALRPLGEIPSAGRKA
jgi:hypothetical protein